jgi:Flp pilus assembly protein TadB
MNPALLRAGGWTVAAMVTLTMTGVEWLGQPVEIPLAGLLILTFIPTSDLIQVARQQLERFKREDQDGN